MISKSYFIVPNKSIYQFGVSVLCLELYNLKSKRFPSNNFLILQMQNLGSRAGLKPKSPCPRRPLDDFPLPIFPREYCLGISGMLSDQIYLRRGEINLPFAMHLRVCNVLVGHGGYRICSIFQTHLTTESFCKETRFSGIPVSETDLQPSTSPMAASLSFLSVGN